jgi:drug/metabolite transporter (DMT)-like permease
MADASAILLTSSFFVAILSGPMLGEHIGPWRWGAIIIGLIGAVIVAQPSGNNFNLLGFAVAMCASFTVGTISIFLRSLGKTEHAITTVFYFTLFGTMATGIYMIFKGHAPSIYSLLPLIGTAICSLVSLLLKTEAYKYGEASSMAPCHYTSILWSTLLGILFFHDMPTMNVFIGSMIIIASNGFIIWREQINKNRIENDG